MDTAVGYSVLVRGFQLALSVEGLRPHTADNQVRHGVFGSAYWRFVLRAQQPVSDSHLIILGIVPDVLKY